jgi:hypothetical protein
MRKRIYTLNILYAVFQIALVLVVVDFLAPKGSKLVLIVAALIAIMHVVIFIQHIKKDPFGKTKDIKEVDFDDRYVDMIKKAEELKGAKIPVKFIQFERLQYPAFYHKGIVYINQKDKTYPPHYIEGLIAHELGHAISGYGDKYVLAQIKMSNIARSIIVSFRHAVMRKKNADMNKTVEGFLYYLMLWLTWLDEIILFKYLRTEEYLANKNACLISNGESLRTYYYHVHRRRKRQRYEFDLIHPAPKKMIMRMEKYMDLDEYNKDVYAVDDKIYYVVNKLNVNEQNIAKFNYYIHKANQENPYVNNKIFDCYFRGKGTDRDINKALEYALKAEKQGSKSGYYNIGHCYELLEDYENALIYFNKALNEGVVSARRKIAIINNKLEEAEKENNKE